VEYADIDMRRVERLTDLGGMANRIQIEGTAETVHTFQENFIRQSEEEPIE